MQFTVEMGLHILSTAVAQVPGILPDSITTTALSVLPEHDKNEVTG